jgi:hypothetical protein
MCVTCFQFVWVFTLTIVFCCVCAAERDVALETE